MRTTKFAQLARLLQQTKRTETFNSIQKSTKYLRVYFKMKFIKNNLYLLLLTFQPRLNLLWNSV